MPNIVTIVRGADAPTMPRGDVRQGMVFQVKGGEKRYAAIGVNGRAYSLNLNTGEMASSNNHNSTAIIIGKWAFDLDRTYRPGVGRQCQRSEVTTGEVFTVKGGQDEYVHLGRTSKAQDGWLSIPLARQHNHAVTRRGDSMVTVVANAKVKATLSR
jgi:hypothetical protein